MSRARSIPLPPAAVLLALAGASLALLSGCAHRPPGSDLAPPVQVSRSTPPPASGALATPAGQTAAAAADASSGSPAAAGTGSADSDTAQAADGSGSSAAADAASVDALNGPAADGPAPDSIVTAKPDGLFDRIRDGFMLQDVDEPAIDSQVNWFANHPDFLQRTWSRASLWLYYIVGQLEQRNMPRELALLPVIESAFEPYAYSRARAAGLWQFISDTGRRFGLKQDYWYDGRRDPIEATRAALDYLQALHDEFNGDWLLAIAAYNCGELTVMRAVERNERRGLPTDFWHLKLPTETRGYVPELLAMRRIVATPARYGLTLEGLPDEPYFVQVDTGGQIALKVVAQIANISVDDIYELNPAYQRWATDPTPPYRLLVPADAAEGLQQTLAQLTPDQRMDVDHYTVRRHDTVASIARRYGTTPEVIRELNDLSPSDRPVIDAQLRVPSRNIQLPEKVARAALLADSPARRYRRGHGRPRIHIVRRGDTLYSLAQRLGTDVNTLAELNGMSPDDHLHSGQRLRIGARYSLRPTGGTESSVAGSASHARAGHAAGLVASTSGPSRRMSYVVRRGDTLYGIARLLQVTVHDLLAWNGLGGDAHNLHPGQVLVAFVKTRS
ncbi:MAG TPA: LysM peptidoglycan-binding domain-containing protein [Steroidobacteraceae bacterium]|nr:LysM peptidoglycan-binding domain-containing protein [Steroidobacteraceae bacterium]